MEYLLAHIVGPLIGRGFFHLVRRAPLVFAAIAIAGDCLGLYLVGLWPGQKIEADWQLMAIGVLCLMFYTFLLIFLIIKLRKGTWASFCRSSASLF